MKLGRGMHSEVLGHLMEGFTALGSVYFDNTGKEKQPPTCMKTKALEFQGYSCCWIEEPNVFVKTH